LARHGTGVPATRYVAVMSDPTNRLAEAKFVSLTTYKRNGDGVATPLWLVGDGDHLVMWTPADTWKVKRVRRDPRVTLARCGRRGKVDAGEPSVDGVAEVVDDAPEVSRIETVLRRKYGVEYRIVTLIERLIARGRPSQRVLLRIRIGR
jgi:uncharacterized protein